jgi:hypothetical protein
VSARVAVTDGRFPVARPRVQAPRPSDIARAAALVRPARTPETPTATVYTRTAELPVARRVSSGHKDKAVPRSEARAATGLPATETTVTRKEIVERIVNEEVSEKIERVVREQVDRAIHTNRMLTERLSRQVQSDLYQGVVIERERLGIG